MTDQTDGNNRKLQEHMTFKPNAEQKKMFLWTCFYSLEPWQGDFYQEREKYKKIWPQQSH